MQLISEKKEKSIQFYEVEVPLEMVEEALTWSFRKVSRTINLPGFRKGKAPRSMLERRFGPEIFYDDAIEYLLPKIYDWIIEEYKPEALDRPQADVLTFNNTSPAVFTFEVPVRPDVTLGQYRGVEAVKPEVSVSEEDVNARLAALQDQHARIITHEDGIAAEGDTVTLDFEGFLGEEAFEGGKGEDYTLVLGSGRFIPGFEEQLVGKEVGAPVDVHVTFPEDYRAEHLAGQEAVFHCLMKQAQRKEVSELDDEFAQEVSDFETLSEWKEALLREITDEASEQAKQEFQINVIAAVTKNAELDIPEVLVDRQIDSQIQQFSYNMMRQGLQLQDYLSMIGRTMEDMREDFRPMAEVNVRQMLVIEAIAKDAEIEPTEEDMEKHFAEMAERFEQTVEQIRALYGSEGMEESVKDDVRMDLTVEMLVEAAIPIDAPEVVDAEEVLDEIDVVIEGTDEENQPE